MAVLKIAIAILALVSSTAMAADGEPWPPIPVKTYDAPAGMKYCDSAKEFRLAFKLLRGNSELTLKDPQAIQAALKIAAGCDGATKRFGRVLMLLKKSGVAEAQALATALTFAPLSDNRVDAFVEVFKKVFLTNYLNLDFANALRLSLTMSRNYKGDPKKLQEDFTQLVDFCLSDKGMALDFASCADLTKNLVQYTELYEFGVFKPTKSLFDYLRFNKRTGFTVKDSVLILNRVLSKGEKAPGNFLEMMRFLLERGTNERTQADSLKLSLWVADLSLRPDPDYEKTVAEKSREANRL